MKISGVNQKPLLNIGSNYLKKIETAKKEKEFRDDIALRVKLNHLNDGEFIINKKPLSYCSGDNLYFMGADYKFIDKQFEFIGDYLKNHFNGSDSDKNNVENTSPIDDSKIQNEMNKTLNYLNAHESNYDALKEKGIRIYSDIGNFVKNKKLDKELLKYDNGPKAWQEVQKQFNDLVDTFRLNGFKHCLAKGYFDDGEKVVEDVSDIVRRNIKKGQSDDWINLNSHTLGLDKDFASKEDYIKAINFASDNIKTIISAINSVLKTLPSDDWGYSPYFLDSKA